MKSEFLCLFSMALIAAGCSKSIEPLPDKNTNWLRQCSASSMCGEGLSCVCGLCTTSCATTTDCDPDEDALECKGVESPALNGRCAHHEVSDVAAVCVATCTKSAHCTSYGADSVCSAGACVRPAMGETEVVPLDAGHDAAMPSNARDDAAIRLDAAPALDAAMPPDPGRDAATAPPPSLTCPSADEPLAVAVSSAVWDEFTVRLTMRPTDRTVADLVQLTTVYGDDADQHTVDQADAPFAARVDPRSSRPWPAEFDVYLIFHCGPTVGGVGYQVQVRLDTSQPAASGDVSYEIIPAPVAAPDAG